MFSRPYTGTGFTRPITGIASLVKLATLYKITIMLAIWLFSEDCALVVSSRPSKAV